MVKGKNIVILAEKLYEDLELWYPKIYFEAKGHKVVIAGTEHKTYHGKNGYPVEPAITFGGLNPKNFDAVIIPGGFAPDYLRRSETVLQFVRKMFETEKVVAAICHAGWVLISAQIIKGKRVTGYYAIRDDLINAGVKLLDQPVVVEKNLVTSRSPADLPFFVEAIEKLLK